MVEGDRGLGQGDGLERRLGLARQLPWAALWGDSTAATPSPGAAAASDAAVVARTTTLALRGEMGPALAALGPRGAIEDNPSHVDELEKLFPPPGAPKPAAAAPPPDPDPPEWRALTASVSRSLKRLSRLRVPGSPVGRLEHWAVLAAQADGLPRSILPTFGLTQKVLARKVAASRC